jgi:hypothetical protein
LLSLERLPRITKVQSLDLTKVTDRAPEDQPSEEREAEDTLEASVLMEIFFEK